MARGKGASTRRRGSVARGDAALEAIFWDAGTARLPPRLIGERREGPVFLTERRPAPGRARTARDVDPVTADSPTTGRPRCSTGPPPTSEEEGCLVPGLVEARN